MGRGSSFTVLLHSLSLGGGVRLGVGGASQWGGGAHSGGREGWTGRSMADWTFSFTVGD